VFGSMLLFLGPVVLAVTGAGFGGTEQGQLLGAVAGLAVGMTASAGVAAVVRRTT